MHVGIHGWNALPNNTLKDGKKSSPLSAPTRLKSTVEGWPHNENENKSDRERGCRQVQGAICWPHGYSKLKVWSKEARGEERVRNGWEKEVELLIYMLPFGKWHLCPNLSKSNLTKWGSSGCQMGTGQERFFFFYHHQEREFLKIISFSQQTQ